MFFFLGVYGLQPDECRPRDDMLLEKKYPWFSRFSRNHNPLALNFSGDMTILQVGVRTLDVKKKNKKTKKSTFHLGGGMTDFAHLVEGLSHIVHKNIYISSIKFTVLFTLSPPPSFDELLALTSCGGYLQSSHDFYDLNVLKLKI